MKLEDFPLVEFADLRLRRVPELRPYDEVDDCRCSMCAFSEKGECSEVNEAACAQLGIEDHCGDNDIIYLPEENFTEYVVEVVRRRVS